MEIDIEQLAKIYAELSDEKLLRMHDAGELTETAYSVLEKEFTRRGIPIPEREETNGTPVEMPSSWGSKNINLIILLFFALNFLDGRYLGEIPSPSWLSRLLVEHSVILWAAGIICLLMAVAGGVVRQLYDYLYRSAGRLHVKDEKGKSKELLVGEVPPKFWYQYSYSGGIRIISWFLVAALSAAFGLLVGMIVYPPQNGVLTSKVIFMTLFVSYGRFLVSWGLARILVSRLE